MWTVAPEGALCVHTAPVRANAREHVTLVHIFTADSLHSGKASGAGSIQLAVFTGAPPRRSQRGTALRLQSGSVDIHFAAPALNVQPTRPLHAVDTDGSGWVQLAAQRAFTDERAGHVPAVTIHTWAGFTLVHIFTGFRVGFEDVAGGAGAGVAAGRVTAQSVVTQQHVDRTLINIDTVLAADVRLVADVADAAVTAPQVFTNPIGADVGVKSALVDISSISCDPDPAATESLEFSRGLGRAGLARLPEAMVRAGTAAL